MPSFLRPLVMAVVLAATPALADDITDAIGRAQEAYASGDLSSSRQALGEASHFLDQMIVEKLATFLPEDVSGWSFDTSSDSSSAGSMLGAGNQVTRNYTSGDDKTITLQITAGSTDEEKIALIKAIDFKAMEKI